jgi:NAD-dependent DNA ligase
MLQEQHITNFKTHGISVLEKLPESELNQMLILANDRYYNENPIMTDIEYDIVKEFIEHKFPRNTVIDAIGAPISGKNKVKLPYEMWSMDKIKPDSNALASWKLKYKGPYTLSCKLDGVSGMYVKGTNKGTDKGTNKDSYKLYTRGNGLVGQDISHLIEPLHLPKLPFSGAIRGEFIIPKHIFQEKYKDKYANPRNMVAGIINKQSSDERIEDLKFVTYEIIEPKMEPSKQLQTLQTTSFDTVMYKVETSENLTNELLSRLLLEWRQNYDYEIDGIIVTDDHIHKRISSNPDHAFAFKMVISDQMAEAKVVDVLWEASKSGYLKPRVRIEPIQLGGVRIEFATGFNGKFIEDNRIGVGAIIQIIRSGDVIPYIQSITKPAEITKMPEQAYHWTESHVDIILNDLESDPKVLEKLITAFFVELGVDGLAKGNIKRLIDTGFNSISKIIQMTKSDFEKVGFKTLADKFVSGISAKIDAASLPLLMSASNKMGRGISGKTIEIIMAEEPLILTSLESNETKIDKLVKIKGIGKIVTKTFVENIGEFLEFLRECKLEYKLNSPIIVQSIDTIQSHDTTHPLFGKKIVMTKVRDQEIIQKLEKVGAILADTVNSDTFVVIVKSKDDSSSKIKKALEKNIPITTPDEFKIRYLM